MALTKGSSCCLQKNVSKFTTNKFYEIDPWPRLAYPDQGDQIGRFFNIGLLFTWVFLNYTYISSFKTYFNIQKHFDTTIFDFQFELLKFGYSFGYISENWVIFFKLLVTHMSANAECYITVISFKETKLPRMRIFQVGLLLFL